MKRILKNIVVLFVFLWLASSAVSAQIKCVESDGLQTENLLSDLNTNNKKARTQAEIHQIGIKAIIVHPTNETQTNFSTSDVSDLVNHANTYFKNIGITFYLIKGEATHVFSDEFANFKTIDEQKIRNEYDITSGINVYFFKSISDEKGNFLNGTAPLPTLAQNSNRIFLSYLDKNPSDFETLKNKVFLHELGHYFGLLHTFQDSNNENIAKRELVLRDISSGGNCHITGDLICDTQADPFERLASVSSYDCTEKLPSNLVDALGYTYSPPIDNIMSYHIRCGNTFSPQQYQRMQTMFSIRFSTLAAYKLIGNQANGITITSLNKKEFCEGELVKVSFDTFGDFGGIENFFLELSDQNGLNFKIIAAAFLSKKEVQFVLPSGLTYGINYRIRVGTTLPFVYSSISESLIVNTKGDLQLIITDEVIRPGNKTNLVLQFSGSGPWTATFDNGIVLRNISSRNHVVTLQPSSNSTYRISNATGACGNVTIQNTVSVKIADPILLIDKSFNTNVCENSQFQLPISGLKNSNSTVSNYEIKLSNADTTITLKTLQGTNSLTAISPFLSLTKINRFQLSVTGKNPEDYSLPTEIVLRQSADIPTVTSPVSFCFNSAPRPLFAFGTNLKWYNSQSDLNAMQQVIPATSNSGKYIYYVTQTNTFGCESKRTPVVVDIKQPVTATLSGDNIINFGESTELTIRFTGDIPYKVELSDGQTKLSSSPTLFTSVKPFNTETYTLLNATNTCGNAFVSGSAKVVVRLPLGVKEEYKKSLNVFPNPVEGDEIFMRISDARFVNKQNSIQLFDLNGKLIKEEKNVIFRKEQVNFFSIKGTILKDINYILRINNGVDEISNKVIIRK